MNMTLNLTNLTNVAPWDDVTRLTAQACNYYPGAATRLAIIQLILSVLALFWFGSRQRLQNLVKHEGARRIIGHTLITANAVVSAILAENLVRWSI